MEKYLFVISKGFEKSGAATRAVQLASIAAEKGLHVEVFLIDDAIPLGATRYGRGYPCLNRGAYERPVG